MTEKTLEQEILDELENEKSDKKAKKGKKKKNASSKAKDNTNALLKPLLILITGIWIGCGALIASIEMGISSDINQTTALNHINTISSSALSSVNYQVQSVQRQIDTLAKSDALIDTLFSGTPEEKATLANILKGSFNYSESLLIIPWDHTGTVGLKSRNIPLRNSIEISLMTKTGEEKKPQPEAYLYEGKWLMSFITPIMHEKKVIGALLVTLNGNFLKDIIKKPYFTENSKIVIVNQQQADKPIASAGTINTTNPVKYKLAFTGGQLLIHVDTKNTGMSAPFTIIYIIIGLGAVFLTVLTFAIYILNLRAIKQDCESLVRFAESKSGIHKTKKPKLAIPAHAAIADAIDTLSKQTMKTSVTPRNPDEKMTLNSGDDLNKTVISPSVQAGPPPDLIAEADVNENNSFDHPEIFRDYDIRGIADEQLTPDAVIMIGKAIGSEAVAQGIKNIVIGRDGRLSSERIKKNLIKGLCSTGCNVMDIDLVPSPVLYYATHKLGTEAGVMITGSHNPPEYNGFKIILGGKTLQGVQIQSLLKRIEDYNITEDSGTFSTHNVVDDYVEEISMDIIIAKPLKVVLDASNGAGGEIATKLFAQLDCEVMPLNCEIDGNFPGHGPDPSNPENLKDLIENVINMQADIGIAFDGDADRMVAVTSSGKIVDGDQLLMIFAKDIVSRNPAANVIFDVKCSNNISKIITEFGGRPIMWKSGHSHIKAKMQETGALLGGEYTGHFFFKERWHGFDDGIYAALRLVELLTTDEETLDARLATLPTSFSTKEILIPVSSEGEKTQIITSVQQSLAAEEGNINTLDGIRIDYENGWGLVRASNTSPVISCRFEAENEEELARIKGIFKNALQEASSELSFPF